MRDFREKQLTKSIDVLSLRNVIQKVCRYHSLIKRQKFSFRKVLFFDHSLKMGGAERSLLEIISGLQGFNPVFVTPSNHLFHKFKSIGIRSILFPMPLGVLKRKREKLFAFSDIYNIPTLILRFVKLLKREKPEIVYTNTQKAHLIGVIASKIARISCISHFRDILPNGIFTRVLLRLLCSFATQIIAISKAVANTLPARMKVRIIYNGVKINNSHNTNEVSQVKTVGYVGQIARWKGVKNFIEAAHLVLREMPDTNFIVVGGPIFGDTEYLDELKKLARGLSLDGRIRFIGEKEDILPYINNLDILVHPPILPEPFGRILIEAASLCKPVIATNVGAIPEIIEDGVTGILIPPHDPNSIATGVKRLITNPELARYMGMRGRERVYKYFNFDTMIKEIEEVMENAIV